MRLRTALGHAVIVLEDVVDQLGLLVTEYRRALLHRKRRLGLVQVPLVGMRNDGRQRIIARIVRVQLGRRVPGDQLVSLEQCIGIFSAPKRLLLLNLDVVTHFLIMIIFFLCCLVLLLLNTFRWLN